MRLLATLVFVLLLPLPVAAQTQGAPFDSYGDYEQFVDGRILLRDYAGLVQRLGGSPAKLDGVARRFPGDFTSRVQVRKSDLGQGLSRETRIYWDRDIGYTFFRALLQLRGNRVVVLDFSLGDGDGY